MRFAFLSRKISVSTTAVRVDMCSYSRRLLGPCEAPKNVEYALNRGESGGDGVRRVGERDGLLQESRTEKDAKGRSAAEEERKLGIPRT